MYAQLVFAQATNSKEIVDKLLKVIELYNNDLKQRIAKCHEEKQIIDDTYDLVESMRVTSNPIFPSVIREYNDIQKHAADVDLECVLKARVLKITVVRASDQLDDFIASGDNDVNSIQTSRDLIDFILDIVDKVLDEFNNNPFA